MLIIISLRIIALSIAPLKLYTKPKKISTYLQIIEKLHETGDVSQKFSQEMRFRSLLQLANPSANPLAKPGGQANACLLWASDWNFREYAKFAEFLITLFPSLLGH